jgi:hypothetical protein
MDKNYASPIHVDENVRLGNTEELAGATSQRLISQS